MSKCHDCSEKATTKVTVHYISLSLASQFLSPSIMSDDVFYVCDIHAKRLIAFLKEYERKRGDTFEVELLKDAKEKVVFT